MDKDQEGLGYTQTTIYKGERMSAEVAYLRPIKSRKNLTIITNSLGNKITYLRGKKCIGAEVKNKNKLINICRLKKLFYVVEQLILLKF